MEKHELIFKRSAKVFQFLLLILFLVIARI